MHVIGPIKWKSFEYWISLTFIWILRLRNRAGEKTAACVYVCEQKKMCMFLLLVYSAYGLAWMDFGFFMNGFRVFIMHIMVHVRKLFKFMNEHNDLLRKFFNSFSCILCNKHNFLTLFSPCFSFTREF